MVQAVPGILSRIVEHKRQAFASLSQRRSTLESLARDRTPARDFRAALQASPAVIAEIKKASPSKGVLAEEFDPPALARKYAAGGANALSVLTDREFFRGSLADLEAARAAVTVPVLRKDFTICELHVVEAAAHGADAILLIAALLDRWELREFRELATAYGMAALVEVHIEAELDSALDSGAEIVGVNNRDLNTFEVHLETSLHLAPKIPDGVIRVSESGIHSSADIQLLRAAGFHAFLVGEHLMKSADAAAALRELIAT